MSRDNWEDFYDPIDFLGWADKLAAEFLDERAEYSEHSKVVYEAARNAAYAYEFSDKLRKQHFTTVARLFIRTALLKTIRKESEEMGRYPKTPPEVCDDIRKLKAEGLTDAEVGERVGVSHSLVNKVMRKGGVSSDRRGKGTAITQETREEVLRLKAEGLTDYETSVKLGIGKTSVNRIWKEAQKEAPETAVTVPDAKEVNETEENIINDIIPPSGEKVKPSEENSSEGPAELDTVDVMHLLVDRLRSKDVDAFQVFFRYREKAYKLTLEEARI